MADLRDIKGGTYDTVPGKHPEQTLDRKPIPNISDRHDVDDRVRAEYDDSQSIPAGLVRERKGPLGPNTGRRKG